VAVIFLAASLPGETIWLARKSPCDEIGADAFDVSDVPIVGHIGPVAFKDFAGIGFDFRKADGLQSRRFSGERKAADAAEKVEMCFHSWRTQYIKALTEDLRPWEEMIERERNLQLGVIEDLVDAGYMASRITLSTPFGWRK
jgi:tetrahydromethanopterin S-methyltransferase subunit F